eukprot:1685264-Pyramimonas_sp.AAC.1
MNFSPSMSVITSVGVMCTSSPMARPPPRSISTQIVSEGSEASARGAVSYTHLRAHETGAYL